ncbi:MAG: hypothetical protein HY268_27935 [Deltaproteobacteria bacterium]|nr:hypothetical protein [Deltaproteobacteria bacterium]
MAAVEKQENEINFALSRLREPESIINDILCDEFRYPLKEHQEQVQERHFVRGLGTMAAGFMLRNSAKCHHPDFELTERFFARTPHERLKAFVAVPIRLGTTATKGDLIEEGDAYYVHPGATKKQRAIALEDCHQITQGFYGANQRRFGLRRGDVVINRSGEALGKVAFFDSDEPAVASDFTMRVRFNARMNPRFAWFFFRSVMFQSQVLRELRGSSVPNIFPPQVEQMLIAACDRDCQDALAQQIGDELQALDDRHASIESKRQEIDRLIDEAVSNARQ